MNADVVIAEIKNMRTIETGGDGRSYTSHHTPTLSLYHHSFSQLIRVHLLTDDVSPLYSPPPS
jgi:hypothetical protein